MSYVIIEENTEPLGAVLMVSCIRVKVIPRNCKVFITGLNELYLTNKKQLINHATIEVSEDKIKIVKGNTSEQLIVNGNEETEKVLENEDVFSIGDKFQHKFFDSKESFSEYNLKN